MPKATASQPISHSRLLEVLHYDPLSGVFTRKIATSTRCKVGEAVGTITPVDGGTYLQASLDKRRYYMHVLAWFYVTGKWPASLIKHMDRDGMNNRWSNLYEASNALIQHSRSRAQSGSSTGIRGITRARRTRADGSTHDIFIARIKVNGQRIYLGQSSDQRMAHAMYQAADRLYQETIAQM